MKLDSNKLIVQQDGDAGDTLANQATWAIACALNPKAIATPTPRMWALHRAPKAWDFSGAQIMLECGPGLSGKYVRCPKTDRYYWWNNPDTVSRDQLLPVILANTLCGLHDANSRLLKQIIKRGFFAQNKFTNGDNPKGPKTPDTFIGHLHFIIRACPIARWILWPVLLGLDSVDLLVSFIPLVLPYRMKDGGKLVRKTYDDSDIRNAVLGHIMAMQCPTPFSWLHRQIFSTFMHQTFGMIEQPMWPRIEELNAEHPITREVFDAWLKHCPGETNKVTAALLWYFRLSSGGNPEIVYALQPTLDKYFKGF
jgi:hypothetical protein